MSGGWTVAIGAQTENPDEAFDFLTYVFNYDNNLKYVVDASQLAVRSDVGEASEYLESDPYIEFFTGQVQPDPDPTDETPPVVEEIGDVSVAVGGDVLVKVIATDDSELGFTAAGLPGGVAIDPVTGVISGSPTVPGSFAVTVTVTDAAGNTTEARFRITVSPKPDPDPDPGERPYPGSAPYTVQGYHLINDRRWLTTCEPYSQTMRCRTEIWATTVQRRADGGYTVRHDWAFNNLTYLPYLTREQWSANPLGYAGSWTGDDGARWRTVCDTPETGGNACRTYRMTTVYDRVMDQGSWRYFSEDKWVFNNQVLFGNYTL